MPGERVDLGALGAEQYLTHVLDLLQNNSLDRNRVDWPQVRREAFAEAAGARTTADTYDAIDLAVKSLDNPHTFFMRPEQAAAMDPSAEAPGTTEPPPMPRGHLVGPKIGYVSLPTTDKIPGYARTGAQVVRTLDASKPCGWIVDLREDSGGAIWPKLDVLAPLLGDGRLGAFVDADGKQSAWELNRGKLSVGGEVIPKDVPPDSETGDSGIKDYVTHNAYVLHRPRPPAPGRGPHGTRDSERRRGHPDRFPRPAREPKLRTSHGRAGNRERVLPAQRRRAPHPHASSRSGPHRAPLHQYPHRPRRPRGVHRRRRGPRDG